MKVLIGTPIHVSKDYCMEEWLQNVAKLCKETSADLLMVDNSPDLTYLQKVTNYCQKYKITNYQIKHLEIEQENSVTNSIDEQIHKRVAFSQEFIRNYILSKDYDAWFSWECDQIIPEDALNKLIKIMENGKFILVNHNCWDKNVKEGLCFDLGVSLVSRSCLEKYSFLLKDKNITEENNWYNCHMLYRKKLKKDGARFIDLSGVISPILHI